MWTISIGIQDRNIAYLSFAAKQLTTIPNIPFGVKTSEETILNWKLTKIKSKKEWQKLQEFIYFCSVL